MDALSTITPFIVDVLSDAVFAYGFLLSARYVMIAMKIRIHAPRMTDRIMFAVAVTANPTTKEITSGRNCQSVVWIMRDPLSDALPTLFAKAPAKRLLKYSALWYVRYENSVS